jgi:hypothetical protein
MKIVVTTDYQCDYLANGLLAGLYESGHDIFEVPALKSVRGGVDDTYILPDGKIGMTGPPGYLSRPEAYLPPARPYAEAVEAFKTADLVIMLSLRDYSKRAIHQLSRESGRAINKLPLVMCEGEDYDAIDYRIIEEFSPKAFFKREIPRSSSLTAISNQIHRPVWPLPFSAFTRGYDTEAIDDKKKTYDLFLSLGHTHPARLTLLRYFLEAATKGGRKSWIATNEGVTLNHPHEKKMKKMLPWPDYIQTQAKSKITAVIRGWGRDTLHAWEAFSFATLVLYCDPGIHIPFPFQDGVHCVKFDESCSQIPKLIETYLEDEAAAWQIAQAGKRHLWEHHTNQKRAEYLVDVAHKIVWKSGAAYEEYGLT